MPAADDFHNNPGLFLNNNLVVQGAPNEPLGFHEGDVLHFTVLEQPAFKVLNRVGMRVCIMKRLPAATAVSVAAYWCPYKQNDVKYTNIGNAAGYVFTPTMDGCTLGLGSYDGNGGRRIGHANMARTGAAVSSSPTNESRDQQARMQGNFIKSELGLQATLLNPSDYQNWTVGGEVNNAIKTTTWGSHVVGGDWSFYVQSYIKAGSKTFTWRGVRQLV
jgi:hypothetical protein